MTILVAVRGMDAEAWVARLKEELPGREVVLPGDIFDRRAVHYVAAWKHPPGSLAGLPNLAAVFSLGAGVDHLLTDDKLPDVPVLRVVDTDLTARMSEYVVLHCLSILRQTKRYERQQRERVWEDDDLQPAAAEVRVGVMGLGVLGADAARKLAVMGFDVAGWSRTPKHVEGIRSFAGAAELGAFLGRTDILVVLLPLTPDTQGVVDRRLLGGLARDGRLGGPFLINAGRGGLQREADILAALDDGSLAGATLDVFETEPLPQDSRFWTHEKVVLTPHNAADTDPDEISKYVARQIERFEAGGALENVVDRKRGY